MTVAKLDLPGTGPGEGGVVTEAILSSSPSDAFSSPLSAKQSPELSAGADFSGKFTTTTTTTTTRITSTKTNGSSTQSKSKYDDSDDPDKIKHPVRKLGPKMNPIYKGLRALAWALYFNLGASLVSLTQVLSLPLLVIAPGVYHRHIKRTEGHFGALLLKMNQIFAPSDIVLTGDESVRGIVKVYNGRRVKGNDDEQGTLRGDETLLDIPERVILLSNHQIYSDWMYLWCLSYFAGMHKALKIILRGDLTWIPVFGWVSPAGAGMRFFDFILLKRNDWTYDKRAIESNLERTDKKEPLWLVVFPEGTVVSRGTRKRSTAFAEKTGLKDHRHVLLPRTSGLFVCINKLRGSVEYVYDATVGYSNIHYGEIPQELYPLPGLYVDKAQPKEINMHLRRFAIKDIPESEPEFVEWVRARWHEKDGLMEEFYTTGKFPSQLTVEDIGGVIEEDKDEKKAKEGQSIRIPLKLRTTFDFVSPLNLVALPLLAFAIRYALQQS
ncbi:hypothetical protein EDD11_002073 [Mortierella claussenii]|nr:hypothetical protein EDD11_002073 [Mortierella claussenii]